MDIHVGYCPERVLPGNIIKELKNNKTKLLKSKNLLSKCVSIPIFYNMSKEFPNTIYEVLNKI